MNSVIDEDLPRETAQFLKDLGFTPLDIRDHGLRGKSDDEIFTFAQLHKAVIFTADLDFSSILRFPPGTHHGICVLRYPNLWSNAEVFKHAKTLLSKITQADFTGNLIIVSPNSLRIRHPVSN
jgi:predicted nuclease of predicted toxin-antitoxin system